MEVRKRIDFLGEYIEYEYEYDTINRVIGFNEIVSIMPKSGSDDIPSVLSELVSITVS